MIKKLKTAQTATSHFKHSLQTLALGVFALAQIFNIQMAAAQSSYGWDWDIKNFDTNIQINADSTINVTEHIVVDFSREQHHGIFRLIPVKYVDNNGHHSQIPIHVLSVTNDKGKAWDYDVTDEGDYLNIKIGNPNVYVNQVVSYNINYKAERALGNYDTHDEIYWNATGDKWEVPITEASATVKLPQTVDQKDLKVTCYTGSYGSTQKNCTSQVVDGTTLKFTATPVAKGEPALQSLQG